VGKRLPGLEITEKGMRALERDGLVLPKYLGGPESVILRYVERVGKLTPRRFRLFFPNWDPEEFEELLRMVDSLERRGYLESKHPNWIDVYLARSKLGKLGVPSTEVDNLLEGIEVDR
jgi:hypothetical protein